MTEWIDIGPHVVSGIINNSEKGKTVVELVIDGMKTPLVLELHGNARPDLAGCILKFRCPRSWPVEPEMREVLPKQRLIGNVGVISGAEKRETYTEEGERPIAAVLCIEWYDFAALERFVIERADCELEIDLPAWTLSEAEIALQDRELKATAETFEDMWEEFEEDQLDQDIYEDQEAKLEAIRPALEAAESDDEKLKLMRRALGPDVDGHELDGWFDALFGPDDTDWDLPAQPEIRSTKQRQGFIELDDEIKAAGRKLSDGARLIRDRVEVEGAPAAVAELVDGVIHVANLLATAGMLEALADGKRRIEPYSMLDHLERELSNCESVIQSLELEAPKKDRSNYSDSIRGLREAVGELVSILNAKKPEQRPPPARDFDDDVPF